ncbi:imelysin family protein [Abyssalbus ytuae]|uniref:Imelysin family protein n=1 Tax=Abyssalbus ytuae TaxID=2926907 RepID=A0A9E7CZZ2_9FLAO|nr:imelysin family protein [Abyssalbus ytuae]UOB17995.1 imelysin family protein [Abyssalbus ytuae]
MNNFNKTFVIFSISLLACIGFIIISCEKGTVTEDEYNIQYNRSAQLNNLYNNGILPIHSTFINELSKLNDAAVAFSVNISSENLIILQNQWKVTASVWSQCELYNIGEIKDSFVHFLIANRPTNTEAIESFISTDQIINKETLALKGASSKGISAIEYLLFEHDNETTLSLFSDNSRRADYLTAAIQVLQDDANELYNLWIQYSDTFVNALQSDLDGGQNQLINAMVSLIEEIIQSKLGKALGDSNGGIITIDELEAYRSDSSLELIENNLIALQKCFTGNFKENNRKYGFDNYLNDLDNTELVQTINSQFEKCFNTLNKINSLNQTLSVNPSLAEELKTDFTNLLILIKVDMSNFIGSTITFNDNDGD